LSRKRLGFEAIFASPISRARTALKLIERNPLEEISIGQAKARETLLGDIEIGSGSVK
jgi:broad specificity phosphatase PhoE